MDSTCIALLQNVFFQCVKFQVDTQAFIVWKLLSEQTKSNLKLTKGTHSKKLSYCVLHFFIMCSISVYKVDSFSSLKDVGRTKIQSENYQRAIT